MLASMLTSRSQIRVRYAETDMMGIAYHANYLPWLEIGRTDLLRENGFPYAELERMGYPLPVARGERAIPASRGLRRRHHG